ncbi:hypothetical protein RRG08_052767 [Elysia crispata]|uniref:EGF-like domain-containing protein n=1 Tax=Elysia crispata TaxID=231223 RepID=A0AAE1B824_9GAST|nr:hypothetical protein RRG08_052767 [Elysia crispata]
MASSGASTSFQETSFTLAFVLLNLDLVQGQASTQQTCPHMRYGAGCLKTCHCHTRGGASCHPVTGKCRCNSGYTGFQCARDVDECTAFESERLCPNKFQYCKNVFGSYICVCQSGYIQKTRNGTCYPCSAGTAGPGCTRQCQCVKKNTATCSTDIGTCVCKPGWEGLSCERSVDDCAGNPCQGKPCRDTHQGHVCLCPDGQFFVKGKCKNVKVVMFIDRDEIPLLGKKVRLYVLYSLPPEYITSPSNLPDLAYQVHVP